MELGACSRCMVVSYQGSKVNPFKIGHWLCLTTELYIIFVGYCCNWMYNAMRPVSYRGQGQHLCDMEALLNHHPHKAKHPGLFARHDMKTSRVGHLHIRSTWKMSREYVVSRSKH
ncbi:uncharacterized protein M421DRAFT_364301 [Didymella exigua CBS 183.55]|uniref:Uncharacterized protein n=1 Tax=Didymella exigua CBS 183.55 TaxID=1150837 RepID=A0A6A5RU60_9PLEO|nr:uncharacterized protein M421DRAFT_364301 [Didymella exigua CBS 183.55]KAF1931013.1 hypothetical protein M421DRAFT_364301 [Didymella exigua CBS 183.55]